MTEPNTFEFADYPPDWPPYRRIANYWFAVEGGDIPRSRTAWEQLDIRRERYAEQRKRRLEEPFRDRTDSETLAHLPIPDDEELF